MKRNADEGRGIPILNIHLAVEHAENICQVKREKDMKSHSLEWRVRNYVRLAYCHCSLKLSISLKTETKHLISAEPRTMFTCI